MRRTGPRIVLDATAMLGARTGIGRYTAQLVGALPEATRAAGLDAVVDVTTWSARGGRVSDLPAGVRQVGPPIPARILRSAWMRSDHPRIELLVGRADLVHGTNFVSPPTRRAIEVVTIHDLTYEQHRDTVDKSSLDYRVLVRRALDRGALVVTPTRTVADSVRSLYGLGSDRVTPTLLGVGEEWFTAAPATEHWLAERGIPQRYVVFVGSLDPRKNLPHLISAHQRAQAQASTTPDLVLAGPAGRATRLSLGPGEHLSGWLPDRDLRALVAGAQALVLPSIDEGFGLPVLEALACGVPVITSDIPVLAEVGGKHALRVDPHDIDALADALTRIGEPTAQATQDRRAWARLWTWSACAAATVAVYGQALARS